MYGDGVVILGRNSYDLPHWKRYRGGARGVLWISRDGGRTFQKFLDLPGNVTSPMLIGGRVYFVSDHEGVGNLYSVDLNGGDLRRHTDFRDFYVRNASTDGRRIAFQAGGDIYLYDPTVGKAQLVKIDLLLSRKAKIAKFVDPMKCLEQFVLASGSRLAVVSRGQAFSVPAWEGAVAQLGARGGALRYKHKSTDRESVEKIEKRELWPTKKLCFLLDENYEVIQEWILVDLGASYIACETVARQRSWKVPKPLIHVFPRQKGIDKVKISCA